MTEHPMVTRFNDETTKLSYFLQGVAASAIAFAMHQTSDREPTWSLLVIAVAVVAWGASFAAGVINSQAKQIAMKNAIALDLIENGRGKPEHRPQAQRQYSKYNNRAMSSHQVQVWALLVGALIYAAGHTVHILERTKAAAEEPAERIEQPA